MSSGLQCFTMIKNLHEGQKYIIFLNMLKENDRKPIKIQNGPFHTQCINMYSIIHQNEKGWRDFVCQHSSVSFSW